MIHVAAHCSPKERSMENLRLKVSLDVASPEVRLWNQLFMNFVTSNGWGRGADSSYTQYIDEEAMVEYPQEAVVG